MRPFSHQTIKLAAGRHRAPEDGMCAMELASMLAGQHYSDRPSCVCPVVCAFLRGYNDALPDALRQELLLRWASEAVGTRSIAPEEVQRRLGDVDAFARAIVPLARRATLSRALGRTDWLFRTEALGGFVGREVARDPALAAQVDGLLDRLCHTDSPDIRWSRGAAVVPVADRLRTVAAAEAAREQVAAP